MKLKSVITARAIWLFDIQDLNPKGKSIFPDLFEWLKEQYHFGKFPKAIDDRDQHGGWAFSDGDFQVKEEIFIAADLAIYSDGLVATTHSSTSDTEAFMENVLESACKDFSLVFDPQMVRRKMYLSEINVTAEGSLSVINPALSEFARQISSALSLDGAQEFQPVGISFGSDQTITPISKQLFTGFSLERKIGAPFSENRYWSKAPLPTDQHLSLLEEFERTLMKQ
jgi:hypothetical protein